MTRPLLAARSGKDAIAIAQRALPDVIAHEGEHLVLGIEELEILLVEMDLFHQQEDAAGMAALAGSWIGGGANMLAISGGRPSSGCS